MPNIIEITDFHAPELDPYARLTQNQLRSRLEPEKGIFIAESPKVICLRSISRETGTKPASSAREITLGLSAMKMPFSGSSRLRSWFCVRRA